MDKQPTLTPDDIAEAVRLAAQADAAAAKNLTLDDVPPPQPDQIDIAAAQALPADGAGLDTRLKCIAAQIGLAIHDPEHAWAAAFAKLDESIVGDLCFLADRLMTATLGAPEPSEPMREILPLMERIVTAYLSRLAAKDDPSPMVALLERALDQQASTMAGSNDLPAVMAIIFFKDGTQLEGAVKREGTLPGTYILAQQMGNRDQRTGQMIPIPGKIVEIAFEGADVLRIATIREVAASLVQPAGGGNGRIWTPQG